MYQRNCWKVLNLWTVALGYTKQTSTYLMILMLGIFLWKQLPMNSQHHPALTGSDPKIEINQLFRIFDSNPAKIMMQSHLCFQSKQDLQPNPKIFTLQARFLLLVNPSHESILLHWITRNCTVAIQFALHWHFYTHSNALYCDSNPLKANQLWLMFWCLYLLLR